MLRGLFSESGAQVTELTLPRDRMSGRPRGFAFVRLGSQEDADRARQVLDGRIVDGKAISARPFQGLSPRREARAVLPGVSAAASAAGSTTTAAVVIAADSAALRAVIALRSQASAVAALAVAPAGLRQTARSTSATSPTTPPRRRSRISFATAASSLFRVHLPVDQDGRQVRLRLRHARG